MSSGHDALRLIECAHTSQAISSLESQPMNTLNWLRIRHAPLANSAAHIARKVGRAKGLELVAVPGIRKALHRHISHLESPIVIEAARAQLAVPGYMPLGEYRPARDRFAQC